MTDASSNREAESGDDPWMRQFTRHEAICTCCAAEGLVGWFTDPECPLHGKNAIPNSAAEQPPLTELEREGLDLVAQYFGWGKPPADATRNRGAE